MPLWQGRTVWRVLDTEFGDGTTFLALWSAWEQDPHRPALLHYVAITAAVPDKAVLLQALAAAGAIAPQLASFERQWFGLMPGFHRLELSAGRVLLTVAAGRIAYEAPDA